MKLTWHSNAPGSSEHRTCPSFWIELGKKQNKDCVTPTACRYGRKRKKELRNGHTNANIDNNARPVRHVAVLAMTTARLENTTHPTDDEGLFVDTPVLTVDADWLLVDMLEAPRAQSQSSLPDFNTNPNSHDCYRNSNLRQARHGHRGDAHNGEASDPGPKRTSH